MQDTLNYAARQQALDAYDFGGPVLDLARFGGGHINETYCVRAEQADGTIRRFVLQRVNSNVFKRPEDVAENISNVTHYLRKIIREENGDPERETLRFLKTKQGKDVFRDGAGGYWRSYIFVDGSYTLQQVEKPEDFYSAAKAFGGFLYRLRDFDASVLHETIPQFHDTPKRFRDFCRALGDDPFGRSKTVSDEIDFVLSRRKDCAVLMDLLDEGKLPLRVTHNDTKLNNILFDENTGDALCVIDLDTIMPGLSLSDFGDAIRFGATTAAEDEPDLEQVNFDLNLYEVYVKGYLEGTKGALTDMEIEYLPWGAKLLTFECGMRFLADYLQGDTYFRTRYPDHNLIRARTQFKLVSDMEKHWNEMHEIVNKYR